MDIKEFVKETLSAIMNATSELQQEFEQKGVVINPPTTEHGSDVFEPGSHSYTYRRVERVEFDIAVTAAGETAGGGKAGLRVFSVDAGLDGSHSRRSEEVSRVKFAIPVSFGPSGAEGENRNAKTMRNEATDRALANRRSSLSKGG